MKKLKKEFDDKSSLEIAKACYQAAIDNKAEDVVVLDVQKISGFTDYFIIMSGRSTRHVQGLAEAIEHKMRSKRLKTSNAEGLNDGLWVLLDLGVVVVHIFYHAQRSFYDLESLWYDAKKIEI
jgi:ribosome-associated protein